MKGKAVILDADGMLVHGERFSSRLERDFGITLEKTGPFFSDQFQKCIIGKADLIEELDTVIESWGWNGTTEELLRFWFAEMYNIIDDRFFPIIDYMRERGTLVYLATNNEKYRTQSLVERGLDAHFDQIFSSAFVGSKKPQADFFDHIVRESSLEAEHIVFWDDAAENIAGAAAYGFKTIQFTSFEQFTNISSG